MRTAAAPSWMQEADINLSPLKPVEVMETLAAIRDVQADVVTHFNVFLCSPSSAAWGRLVAARQREQEVFETILGQGVPRWLRKYQPRKRADAVMQLQGQVAANE